jgi:hypothetical protein
MIAFLVLAHTDPDLLRRLVTTLSPHDVFVHVDAKTQLDERWQGIDARFLEHRVPVYWAGYSQVEATILLIREALGAGVNYERLVLLSGSDYPARPISDLEALFRRDRDRNFMKYVAVESSAHLTSLVSRRYFRDGILPWQASRRSPAVRSLERILRKGLELANRPFPVKMPADVRLVHGSAYWALTQNAAEYLLSKIDSKEGQRYVELYIHAFASDEQFFHTVIANSVFAESSTGEIAYEGRGTYRTANLHLIDPSLAKWFVAEDIAALDASEMYFVRKVRSGVSDELLDILDDRSSHDTGHRRDGDPE